MKPSRKSLMSVLFFVLSSSAVAAENYQLTISNGSAMPISPPAIYFMNGSMGISELGTTATPGFIKICQSGDSSGLLAEVSSNPSSAGSGALKNQILPGQKRTVLIRTSHPQQHSVHIVAMYGKTKDVCAVIKISSDDLTALAEGRVKEINRVDQVVSTGAFMNPALPAGANSNTCTGTASAVDCLRKLSNARSTIRPINFFQGYLPSVINFLEGIYGAEDAQTLLFQVGSVHYNIRSL